MVSIRNAVDDALKMWEPGRIANLMGLSFACYQGQHRGCNQGHFLPRYRCE